MKITNDHFLSHRNYEKLLLRFLIFPMAMGIQFLLLPRLPEKYFYDSHHILSVFLKQQQDTGGWIFTANFFHWIDFFHFTELAQWSFFLAFVFNIVLFCMSLHYQFTSAFDYIFFYCTAGLLNIYVFRMSKDIIQFLIFLIAVAIIKSKLPLLWKTLLTCLLFTWEGFVFRSYYFLIAGLFLVTVFLQRTKSRAKKRRLIILLAAVCLLGLISLQFFSYRTYLSVVTVRDSLTLARQGSESAQTLILNPIPTRGSLGLFLLDYVINFFRLMLPLELLPKGPAYYLFILFQFYLSFRLLLLFRNRKQELFRNSQQKLLLGVVIAYYVVSAIFEPDFGSFIRHEAALSPVLFALFYDSISFVPAVKPEKHQSKYIRSSGRFISADS